MAVLYSINPQLLTRALWLPILFIGALVSAGVVWLLDPFLFGALAVMGLGASVLLAIVSGVRFLSAVRTQRPRQPWLQMLGASPLLATLIGAGIPLNIHFQNRAAEAAKAYPFRVAPLLENYRRTHGSYPKKLSELPSVPPLPRLLRRHGYHQELEGYSFTFPEPGGLINTWVYDSQSATWELSR